MCGVTDAISDVVSGVTDTVSDVFDSAGDVVGDVVDTAFENPELTAALIAMAYGMPPGGEGSFFGGDTFFAPTAGGEWAPFGVDSMGFPMMESSGSSGFGSFFAPGEWGIPGMSDGGGFGWGDALKFAGNFTDSGGNQGGYGWDGFLRDVTRIGAPIVLGNVLGKDQNRALEAAAGRSSEAARATADIAREQWDRYKTLYGPVEAKLAADVNEGIDPEAYADEASADVIQAFNKARAITSRNQARYGLNPGSPAATDAEYRMILEQGKAEAFGRNKARTTAEDTNFARRFGFVNTGKSLPSNATTMLNQSATTEASLAKLYGDSLTGIGKFVGGLPWDSVFGTKKQPQIVIQTGGAGLPGMPGKSSFSGTDWDSNPKEEAFYENFYS